jgi:hypothetical protein
MRIASAVPALVKLRQRERGTQLEAPRLLLLCDSN